MFLSIAKGSELWRCRRLECGLDNETSYHKFAKAAACAACDLRRGADAEAVTEEDIAAAVRADAAKRDAAAARKRAATAAAPAGGGGAAKLSKKAKADAATAAKRDKAAAHAAAQAAAVAAGPWKCPVCTLENAPTLACAACDTARALPSASEAVTGGVEPEEEGGEEPPEVGPACV